MSTSHHAPVELDDLLRAAPQATEAELLAIATKAVVALLGDRGSAVLFDGDPRIAYTTRGETVPPPLDLGRYPEIPAAVEAAAPVVIGDVHADVRLAAVRAALPPALARLIVLPLLGTRPLGVLHIQAGEGDAPSDEAITTARLIAAVVAARLEALRLRAAAARAPLASGTLPTAALEPPDEPDPAAPSEIPSETTQRTTRPPRILLVEDDPEQAEAVELLLGREGYAVTHAGDGPGALLHARDDRPDLILLDVGLPGVDGFDVAFELSLDEATSEIPILFLSAAPDLMSRVRQLRLGAVDFLAKPYRLDALMARVDRALVEAETRGRLRRASYLDELTGLHNLRYLQERLPVEQARSTRYGTPLAIVMLDVDRLKQVNDGFGHAVGSQLLAGIGEVLRAGIRESDVAVRYGGDEFVVVLPHASPAEARGFGERMLARIRALPLPIGVEASASIGVASWRGDGASLDELFRAADEAAYVSKRAGGGRVSVAEVVGPPARRDAGGAS